MPDQAAEAMEGGGESPNGVVIDPRPAGGKGFYNRDPELNDVVCALCGDGGELLWWVSSSLVM